MVRALVTGASRGIGRAIALELATDCSTLLLAARTVGLLERVRAEVSAANPACTVVACPADVTDPCQAQACMDCAVAVGGGIDVLVNCAGKAIPATGILEVTTEQWNELFAANSTSVFLMTKAAIPSLRRSDDPVIVNIASTAGVSPRPGWSAYAASKASVVSFSLTMAEELRPYGIRVYCIAPGRTATELRRILAPDEDPDTIMQPTEVARVVRFLVSRDGTCLHGQVVTVRGLY